MIQDSFWKGEKLFCWTPNLHKTLFRVWGDFETPSTHQPYGRLLSWAVRYLLSICPPCHLGQGHLKKMAELPPHLQWACNLSWGAKSVSVRRGKRFYNLGVCPELYCSFFTGHLCCQHSSCIFPMYNCRIFHVRNCFLLTLWDSPKHFPPSPPPHPKLRGVIRETLV